MRLDRRAVLAGGAALAAGTPLTAGHAQSPASDDQFEVLRRRWVTMLTGDGVVDSGRAPYAAIITGIAGTARRWWTTMADFAVDPPALWDDPLSKLAEREYNTRVSADRLRVIALAWATPGSSFSGRADVASRLVNALEWLERRRYSILLERGGNWWEWEIGIPIALLDLLFLLREPLETQRPGLLERLAAAVDRFTPQPFVGTAANRVWRSHVVMLHAIVTGRADALVAARDAVPTTFGDVVSGDGFHRDGSFVQHDTLGYTGGYGRDLLTRSALLFYLLDGSRWAFADAQMRPLRERVVTAFAPLMYRGAIMDMVRGRNVSRANLSDLASGQTITIATLYLAAVLRDDALKAMAKGWIAGERGIGDITAYDPKLPAYWLTPHMAWLVEQAIADRRTLPMPERVETVAFAEMDRLVHRRPDFSLALTMNSARIHSFEIANGENLTGWYAGWGTTTFYRADRPNYADDYWPTVDPYRLPGITLDKRQRPVGRETGGNESAQVGVLANEGAGLAAMLNRTDGGSFTARVSWFALGDAILCLGSGIRSTADAPIETVIANEMMPTVPKSVLVDGVARAITPGEPLTIKDPRWCHLGEAGGVVLPAGGTLHTLGETRSHAWSEINQQGASPTDPRTRSYLTMWLDHGRDPSEGRYAYILLPYASVAHTRAAALRPTMKVSANTPDLHLVQGSQGDALVTAAVFWSAGAAPGGLAASGPLLLLLRRAANRMTLALADPLPAATGVVSVTLPFTGLRTRTLDPALTVDGETHGSVVTLARADLRGRTVVGIFEL